MNQRQWQAVEFLVRKEQELASKNENKIYYQELNQILDELYILSHKEK